MKIPSSFLYDLVHSLTKSEKRYIKVHAGSGEKDYIQLLNALLLQKSFDEDQLIKDNRNANFINHLAVNKRYLYELILKSLTNFGQKSLEDKIFEKINAANVLIEKGLFAAGYSELKKGKKIAEKYELFELQIMLNGIEKQMLSNRQFKAPKDQTIQQVFEVEMNSLDQLKNTNEYWYLAQQMAQFQMRFQKIQNESQQRNLDEITQSPKFNSLNFATNFKSRIYYFQANATHLFIQGKVKEAYEMNRQFLDLLEANPHFLKMYAERYLATLNNMLIDSLIIGKYDILEEGINRLVQILERPEFKQIKNIKVRVFRQRYLLLMNWSLSQGEYSKALEWIPAIEQGLLEFGNKIERHHRITFYYLSAYLLFQNSQFDEALKWNNLILNDPKEDVVKEIFYFARNLNLVIHYELQNFTLLDSLLSSTPKYLKSRRSIYATEKSLFKFLRKLLNCVDKKEKQKLKVDFKNEMEILYQKPSEKRVFNYLDLRSWTGNEKSLK